MNQSKDIKAPQELYQGRWVSRENFRAFVYNASGQKLANSWEEFSDLISSGLWFQSKDEIKPKEPVNIRAGRKAKDGANS